MTYVYNPTDKAQTVGRWTVPALGYLALEESDAQIIANSGSPLLTEGMEGYRPLFKNYEGQPSRD